MSFGTINPVTMNVPQVAYTNEPIKLPDIVGLYQASRTQSLENQKTQAEIEYRRAQALAEQANIPLRQEQTANAKQEGLLKAAEPGLKLIQSALDKGNYGLAQQVTDQMAGMPEFQEIVSSFSGSTYTTPNDIEITTTVDPTGRVVLNGVNKPDGKIVYKTPLPGQTEAMAIAEANKTAEQIRYNTEQVQKQNQLTIEESRDRLQTVDSNVKTFTSTHFYKAAADSMIAIDSVGALAKEAITNPAATEQLKLDIARIKQSGILTDKDVTRALPDPSMIGKLNTAINVLGSGTFSVSDIQNYVNLSRSMKSAISTSLTSKYENFLDQTSTKLKAGNFQNYSKDILRGETAAVVTNVLGSYTPPLQQPPASKQAAGQTSTVTQPKGFSKAALDALNKKAGQK